MISPTPSERFRGAARFAKEHGWFVTIEDRSAPPRDWSGDGVLVTLGTHHEALFRAVKKYMRRGIPVVDLSISRPELKLPRVHGDNDEIARLAAEHLKARGFTSVAWFATNRGNVQAQRLNGFERHFGARVLRLTGLDRSTLAMRLRKAKKPLGVFTYSDYDATKVLNACRDAKIPVPEEVAIIGVDDNRLLCENQSVTISSVQHDHERVGYEGAARLDRLMEGTDSGPDEILIPPLGIATRKSTDIFAASDPLVRTALAYIQSHLAERLNSRSLSAALGTDARRLESAFRADKKGSVKREIIRIRTDRVVHLLKTTDLKLEAIAHEAGFCNAAHLANALRAETNRRPSDFRPH